MKCFNHSKEGNCETSEKLLRLVQKLMTREEGSRATFDRYDVDGSNVGAVMCVTKELEDKCGINIYISNNIQGVSNSILLGSEVKMGEPGLGLSFGDVKWEREISKLKSSKHFPTFRFTPMLFFAFVLLVSLLFALSGVVSNEHMYRFGLSLFYRETSDVIDFAT